MTSLVIDIGNTNTKIAVFKQNDLVYIKHYATANTEDVFLLIKQYQPEKVIISTVKKEHQDWQTVLAERISVKYFDTAMSSGIINQYKTPQTLGADRLAAVIGAANLYPGNGNLVIDAGTCITYDWVDSKSNYFGGSISPGLNMRYKALNNYTDRLPLLAADIDFHSTFGNDTHTSILSGVQNGIKHEMIGFIENYFINEPEMNIVLSGGDCNFFDTLLKNSIFAPYIKNEPYLVLKGLNVAIQNNND